MSWKPLPHGQSAQAVHAAWSRLTQLRLGPKEKP
jgi:hypothetical protein